MKHKIWTKKAWLAAACILLAASASIAALVGGPLEDYIHHLRTNTLEVQGNATVGGALSTGTPLDADGASKGYEIRYDSGTPSDTSDDVIVVASKGLLLDETNGHFPMIQSSTTDDLGQAVLHAFFLNYSLADDAEIVMPTAKMGWGFVAIGDAQEYAQFIFTSAGAVTLIDNSANVAAADTDANLAIYDAGTGIAIKNRLGSTLTVRGVVYVDD